VVIVATAAVLLTNSSQPEEEKVRDAAMNYIKTAHPENASTITLFNWDVDVRPDDPAGMTTYMYNSGFWSAHVERPNDSAQPWNIECVYTHNEDLIWWKGTYQSGTITETSYRMHP
jgi:hypothetical protein